MARTQKVAPAEAEEGQVNQTVERHVISVLHTVKLSGHSSVAIPEMPRLSCAAFRGGSSNSIFSTNAESALPIPYVILQEDSSGSCETIHDDHDSRAQFAALDDLEDSGIVVLEVVIEVPAMGRINALGIKDDFAFHRSILSPCLSEGRRERRSVGEHTCSIRH
jgi:hypothetical protein